MALIRHDIYPARGRKQAKSALLAQRAAAEFATIFTPQGDGNLFAGVAQTEAYNIRHDIYPARGRKHLKGSISYHWEDLGTVLDIRHDIYPARGRKPAIAEKITAPLVL